MDSLTENIQNLRTRIGVACKKFDKDESKITIVAATKTVEPAIINRLKDFSIFSAAENRVQEFMQKQPKVSGIDWHFIGSLQTNKVKYLINRVSLIHSVDRKALVDEIQYQAQKVNIRQSILIQINAGNEAQKSGLFDENQIERLVLEVISCKNITLKGFMAVFPKDALEVLYEKVRNIFLHYKSRLDTIDTLSMGMSEDIETAIKHDATIIRPGRAIFGQRNK